MSLLLYLNLAYGIVNEDMSVCFVTVPCRRRFNAKGEPVSAFSDKTTEVRFALYRCLGHIS